MSSRGLNRFRIWILFLAVLMVATMVSCYTSYAQRYNDYNQTLDIGILGWFNVVFSFGTLFTYIYAIKGKAYLSKCPRAFLVLAVAGTIIFLGLLSSPMEPSNPNHVANYYYTCAVGCYLCASHMALNVATALFMTIEVCWTVKVASRRTREGQPKYGCQGCRDNTNGITVGPEQPSHLQMSLQQFVYNDQGMQPPIYNDQGMQPPTATYTSQKIEVPTSHVVQVQHPVTAYQYQQQQSLSPAHIQRYQSNI